MYEAELAFAGEVADQAAEIGMRYFRGEFRVEQKADKTPVTQADLEIEAAIREALGKRFPGDAVLGEEEGLVGESGRVWVIDPIDGTKNFTAGIQIWATLVALMDEGRPVVGVIGAPALGERYAAAIGSGATMNGERIAVSEVTELAEASVCSSGTKDWVTGPLADRYRSLAARSYRTRSFGDFWGHALVARGSADAMLEPSLRTWDWAALQPIVEEAGGRMSALDGGPLVDHGSALTTNGALHGDLVALFS
ncbi:MAG: inositol monophosphatase [Actinomycetota bacterium]